MSAGLGDLAADAECARGRRQCSDRERGGRILGKIPLNNHYGCDV
jgi:hypothetical protein